MSQNTLEAIRYNPPNLEIINQILLPHETIYESILNIFDGHKAIKTMKVRGAPAIAIVAALSLAVDLSSRYEEGEFEDVASVVGFIRDALEYLKTSRPTAVNLFDAAAKLRALVEERAKLTASPEDIVKAYMIAAEKMLIDDVQDNKNIGRFGAEFIIAQLEKSPLQPSPKSSRDEDEEEEFDPEHPRNIRILTHCNTGSLATAGWGTALGIIRDLHQTGHLEHAYCTETRPYNQGSRLTAYELVYDGIPATLITDSMVSALLKQRSISAIVVGADRVAANGDTANKIGTYQLAISAKYHNVPFIVAAPSTSIDLSISNGDTIPIEERSAAEVITVRGAVLEDEAEVKEPLPDGEDEDAGVETQTVRVAANGINVWNPSFDITPATLITAIVTERGVLLKKDGENRFNMKEFLEKHKHTG